MDPRDALPLAHRTTYCIQRWSWWTPSASIVASIINLFSPTTVNSLSHWSSTSVKLTTRSDDRRAVVKFSEKRKVSTSRPTIFYAVWVLEIFESPLTLCGIVVRMPVPKTKRVCLAVLVEHQLETDTGALAHTALAWRRVTCGCKIWSKIQEICLDRTNYVKVRTWHNLLDSVNCVTSDCGAVVTDYRDMMMTRMHCAAILWQ